MKTKFELININNDVISTSGKVYKFNTVDYLSPVWYAYNVNMSASGADISSYVCYDGQDQNYQPHWVGTATSSDYDTYNVLIGAEISSSGTYHYIDGEWVVSNHSGLRHGVGQ